MGMSETKALTIDQLGAMVASLRQTVPQDSGSEFTALVDTEMREATEALHKKDDAMALRLLVNCIWLQNRVEQDARLIQAAALYLLHESGIWIPYAETVTKGRGVGSPSWRSFVQTYLPMAYETAVARENVYRTYAMRLGWSLHEMREAGLSKLQTARHRVEEEIMSGGQLSPQVEQILREGTQADVRFLLAQKDDPPRVAYRWSKTTGLIFVYVDGLVYEMGQVALWPPKDDKGRDCVEKSAWLGLVEGLMQSLGVREGD